MDWTAITHFTRDAVTRIACMLPHREGGGMTRKVVPAYDAGEKEIFSGTEVKSIWLSYPSLDPQSQHDRIRCSQQL